MKDELDIQNAFALDLNVPRLAEYFGLWAILEEPFRAAVAQAEKIDLHVHVEAEQARRGKESAASDAMYEVTPDGVAIVPIHGAMMKRVDSFSKGTSTVQARQQIRAASIDAEVVGILLHIESPGGTVAGTSLLADEVTAAAAKKPVHAYIEDLGASAAYWVASQATKVYASQTAVVGSIGTYGVIYDQSARATLAGIKVHVIRAGQFKGAGTPGTEIDAEQLANWKRIVDAQNAHFIGGVSKGRKMAVADVEALADGSVHVGQEAVDAKLIDGVRSLDDILGELSTSNSQRRTKTMSQRQEDTTGADANAGQGTLLETSTLKSAAPAARFEELKAGCPGGDNDFLVAQLDAKATLEQAQKALMAEQAKRIEAAEKERDDAKAAQKTGGVDPVGTGNLKGGSGNAAGGGGVDEFNATVQEAMKGGLDRRKAVMRVARQHPDLHQAYIAGTNPQRSKVQGLIKERFEL